MLDKKQKNFLIGIAHDAILHKLSTGSKLVLNEDKIDDNLKKTSGVFISIYTNGELKSSIGNIEYPDKLYKTVIETSVVAAFENGYTVSKENFNKIKIKISIPDKLEKIDIKNDSQLYIKMQENIDGIMIDHNGSKTSFLPGDWSKTKSNDVFLSELCIKAGLKAEEWKVEGFGLFTYTVEEFEG